MAVSKRTRYEVLKRDNYTCRYCRSTENTLTIDHVTPVALGGTDEPRNLVAACRDCNNGKASTSPDSAVVDDVAQDALRWAGAIKQYGAIMAADRRKRTAYARKALRKWENYRDYKGGYFHLAKDWLNTFEHFYSLGLPIQELEDAIRVACTNTSLYSDNVWRYMCGVAWNKIRAMQDGAASILAAEEALDGP